MKDRDEKLAEAKRKYGRQFPTDKLVPRATPKSQRLLEIEQAQKDKVVNIRKQK